MRRGWARMVCWFEDRLNVSYSQTVQIGSHLIDAEI
jgi:hypothetical protein